MQPGTHFIQLAAKPEYNEMSSARNLPILLDAAPEKLFRAPGVLQE